VFPHPIFHFDSDFLSVCFAFVSFKGFEQRVAQLGDQTQLPGFAASVRRARKPQRIEIGFADRGLTERFGGESRPGRSSTRRSSQPCRW